MKTIYVCGPTVYSTPHIGNLRPITTFDIVTRAFNFLDEETILINNFTDIDDKIIKASSEKNITEKELSEFHINEYLQILDLFNVRRPQFMPKVTEHIDHIIRFVKELVELKYAYVVGTNVYFDTSAQSTYGSVSNRKIDQLIFEEGKNKKHPADFALWKETNEGVQYDSPWGKGRPGWHTECAVFVNNILEGQTLDMHGGGIDLLFPHHENEQIQYLAKNSVDITRSWKHTGQINLKGEKISKSIGNVINPFDFASKYGVDVFRFIILTTSYSAPVDLTDIFLDAARNEVEKLTKKFLKAQLVISKKLDPSKRILEIANDISQFNFAKGVKKFWEIQKDFNKNSTNDLANEVIHASELFGFKYVDRIISDDERSLFLDWEKSKKEGDFRKSDVYRERLIKLGLI